MTDTGHWLSAARRIAEETLFPAAADLVARDGYPGDDSARACLPAAGRCTRHCAVPPGSR